MKHQYDGVYIDNFKDHYAIFSDSGEKLAEYDTTKDAKEDIPEWENEVKNESYSPARYLATGLQLTNEQLNSLVIMTESQKKNLIQKSAEKAQKGIEKGVENMFDTDSEEFKKVGNKPYDKSQW